MTSAKEMRKDKEMKGTKNGRSKKTLENWKEAERVGTASTCDQRHGCGPRFSVEDHVLLGMMIRSLEMA